MRHKNRKVPGGLFYVFAGDFAVLHLDEKCVGKNFFHPGIIRLRLLPVGVRKGDVFIEVAHLDGNRLEALEAFVAGGDVAGAGEDLRTVKDGAAGGSGFLPGRGLRGLLVRCGSGGCRGLRDPRPAARIH